MNGVWKNCGTMLLKKRGNTGGGTTLIVILYTARPIVRVYKMTTEQFKCPCKNDFWVQTQGITVCNNCGSKWRFDVPDAPKHMGKNKRKVAANKRSR